jgi:hypothetical protein
MKQCGIQYMEKNPQIPLSILRIFFVSLRFFRFILLISRARIYTVDPVFAKTSPKRSFSVIENKRFGLVFAISGSINSDTVSFRFRFFFIAILRFFFVSLRFLRLFPVHFRFRFLLFHFHAKHAKSCLFFVSKPVEILASISIFASKAKTRAP